MHKGFIVTAVVIAILVVVVFVVVLPYRSAQTLIPTVQTTPASIALQKLITVLAPCNIMGDGSLIESNDGKLYDINTGLVRLDTHSGFFVVTSPNLAYAVSGDGNVYDLKTGAVLFTFKPGNTGFAGFTQFSPDSTILVAAGTGVYEMPSGKQIMPLTSAQAEIGFSPDSKSLAITADGVYDLPSGQRRFAIGGRTPPYTQNQRFSDDGKYLTVDLSGVYEVTTGRRMVVTGGGFFTPDDNFIVSRDGIFRIDTGTAILTYYTTAQPRLSDDGKRMFVFPVNTNDLTTVGWLVYDVASGQKLLERPATGKSRSGPIMSNDGRLLAIDGDGIYDVNTGIKRLSLPTGVAVTFSADGSLIAMEGDGIYEAQTGKRISQIPTLHNEGYYAEVGYAKDFASTVFSLNKQLIADDRALYEVSTGAKLADGNVHFLKDGLLAIQTTNKDGKNECTTFNVVPASSATSASTP
ncbi:MAG: hypothetical protein ABI947_04225 [Chloroflexota bacterium]